MPDLLNSTFLIAAIVAFIAGMVRGFTGFGAAMMMTPVFSALYGPARGVVLCLILEIAVGLPLLRRAMPLVDWHGIGLLLVAAVVGVPFGNLVLTSTNPEAMRWAISGVVLVAVLLLASGWRYRRRPRRAATAVAGVISGFLNGLSGMAGPPIAFYYLSSSASAAQVRANLTTYFVFVDLLAVATFAVRDLLAWSTAIQGLLLAPAVMLGGMAGERLFPLASEKFYRWLALILLVAVAFGSLIL